MAKPDNYQIQAQQAKDIFLGYDQERLIEKHGLEADGQYLYTEMLCKPYRIHRATGDIQRREGAAWANANTHGEVMTLLDLICDSRDDRWISGRWKNMQSFGLQFHQNLLEAKKNPFASRVQDAQEAFRRAGEALDGQSVPGGDISFGARLFEELRIGVQFWAGDEEFAPRIRYLWDENALMYLKYETMYFAVGMLEKRITEIMESFR